MLTVVTTYFNETPDVLERSVQSILNQTFPNFDYVLIAGNPENASSIALINSICAQDNRVKQIVCNQKTRMTNCLNMGILKSEKKYIALQEADDESLPDRLQTQFDFMEKHTSIDVCGTAIAYRDSDTKALISERYYAAFPLKEFNRYTCIAHPTVFAKASLYTTYGTYLETDEYRNCPDYELFLRWIAQGVKFANINKVLFNYYQSANNGRNKNVKPTLNGVIKLKSKYIKQLNFGLGDKLFLFIEKSLNVLPSKLISKLFYIWLKMKKNN